MSTFLANIRTRRDTAANWTANNPTLKLGELAYETDTAIVINSIAAYKIKIGDGATAWNSLAYAGFGQLIITNPTTDVLPVKGSDGTFDDSYLSQDINGILIIDRKYFSNADNLARLHLAAGGNATLSSDGSTLILPYIQVSQ